MATKFKEKLTASTDIREWFERFELYAEDTALFATAEDPANAGQVAAAKRKNLVKLVNCMDAHIYKTLKNLCRPVEVTTLSYEQAKKLLINRYDPKPIKHAARYAFHRTFQNAGELAADFSERLHQAAEDCQFTNFDESVLDQFIAGLRDNEIQSKLLQEENLTMTAAQRIAVNFEKAASEAQKMSGAQAETNYVANGYKKKMRKPHGSGEGGYEQSGQTKPKKCEKCKLSGHDTKDCKTRCHKCKELGHIRNQCKNKSKPRRAYAVETESSEGFLSSSISANEEADRFSLTTTSEEENLSNFDALNMFWLESASEMPKGPFDDPSILLPSSSSSSCESASGRVSSEFMERVERVEKIDSSFRDRLDIDKGFDSKHDTFISNSDYIYDNLDNDCDSNITIEEFDRPIKMMHKLDLNEHSIEANSDINHVAFKPAKPTVEAWINNKSICMEFDSGSSVSVCSHNTVISAGISCNLLPSAKTLRVANGEVKPVLGKAEVTVTANGITVGNLDLYVVDGFFPSLFGNSWIRIFCGENWFEKVWSQQGAPTQPQKISARFPTPAIGHVCTDKDLQTYSNLRDERNEVPGDLVTLYSLKLNRGGRALRSLRELRDSEVFQPGLGLVKDVEAKLVLKKDSRPIMLKSRPIPFSLRSRVEEELENMTKSGILVKIEDSPWGTPVVPVMRGEKLRICGDYKSTLNKSLETREYPLPTLEECFAAVVGCTVFSVVDIKQAYNNLRIRECDQVLTTLNTHKGLYKWLRLPYGISSSAAIFQGTMDGVLRGVPNCCCRIDDILIGGKDEKEHLEILNEVLYRLEAKGFKCKLEKSQIAKSEVIYLGHRISKDGVRPVKDKVSDWKNAPAPRNADQLISFLSAVNYYRRYLPNLSTVIGPLDHLRKKDTEWKWTEVEQRAFNKLKDRLCSERVLTFYDPKLPLKLDTDASSVGIGAVLSHILPNGEERPIEYISRTLSSAERNYSQIDKEGLGIVWAIKRFHIYLYMRKFRLVTDHQALVHLFKSDKALSMMTTRRVARWAPFLTNYDFDIEYRSTKKHGNCDALSRLPTPTIHSKIPDEVEEIFSLAMQSALLDAEMVARVTRRDPVLSKVLSYTQSGWPPKIPCKDNPELEAYWRRREEISFELGCLMWGSRVIIPLKLRSHVMELLHSTHIGMVGMKSLARSYVWWNKLDSDIEELARTCRACGQHGKSLPKLIDHPWVKPTGPFQRVHMDYAGPFMNCMWLVLQDAFSRWPEVIKMNRDSTAPATVKALRNIFARTGLPMTLVSDNGPQFIATEMENFLRDNGIKHVRCATYSPKSNGLCERFVGTFKSAMKKMAENCKDLHRNLANFLLTYRNTPHSVTGQPPAMMMFNRLLRSGLQRIKPQDKLLVDAMHSEKEQHLLDKSATQRHFEENQLVWVQMDNISGWKEAKIQSRCGETSNTYEVLFGGPIIRLPYTGACSRPTNLGEQVQSGKDTPPALLRMKYNFKITNGRIF